ncbi:hypothetical protein GCM10028791_21610 [Echinicola sediminis]
MGNDQAKTPYLDSLVSISTLFTNAHCQAPICGPSRASVLTGLYPHRSGNYLQLQDGDIKKSNELTAGSVFLPDYFEQNGYVSFGVGKIFHQGDAAKVFDMYGGDNGVTGPKPVKRFNYDPVWFPEKKGKTQTDWGAYPADVQEMPDFKSVSWASHILKARHDKPFFLAVGLNRPHVPWYVPQEYFDLYPVDSLKMPPYMEQDMEDIPESGRSVADAPMMPTTEWLIASGQWKYAVQAYLACISFADSQIGRLLQALKRSDYVDNTIIVLWSDHGYHLGEKNRMAKQSLWERDTHSVLMIKEPGKNSGQVCGRAVQLLDMYPTLVELAGLKQKKGIDGRSLVPLIKDPMKVWDYPALTSYGKGNMAVSYGDFRLIRYADGSKEFYNLKTDPFEWHNLSSDPTYTDRLNELDRLIPREQADLSPYSRYNFNDYFQKISDQY